MTVQQSLRMGVNDPQIQMAEDAASALNGSIPSYPSGVLEYTRQNGEDRVTWQPENGIAWKRWLSV